MSKVKPRILQYQLPGEWAVLVGVTDADNDYLSTEIADPNDWWFHVDGVPGSHVILRARQDVEPSRDTLRQAAAIAAYHSKARNAGTTGVHCTRARNVKKPRGVKTGTVHVSHGDTLRVRPDIANAERVKTQLPSDDSIE